MPGRHAPHLLRRHKDIPGFWGIIIYYLLSTNNVFGTFQSQRGGKIYFKNAAPEVNKTEDMREQEGGMREAHAATCPA